MLETWVDTIYPDCEALTLPLSTNSARQVKILLRFSQTILIAKNKQRSSKTILPRKREHWVKQYDVSNLYVYGKTVNKILFCTAKI
jgi:hypothetical protein